MIALRVALCAILTMPAGCDTPSVDAPGPPYDPTSLIGGLVYHWPAGSGIAVHIVEGPSGADEPLRSAVGTALHRWEGSLAYREHTFRIVSDPRAADIIVRDMRSASPVDTPCRGPGWTDAAATTFFCPLGDTAQTLALLDGAPGRVKVLITVDVAVASAEGRLTPIVLHEVGHALGIGGHSPLSTDIMFSAPSAIAPSRRDARTLRYLLHRRPDLTL